MRRFSYNIFLCCCWIPTLISALIPKKHIKHETMQPFNSLTKIAPSDGTAEHEVVIAITLKNLDLLENIVLDITNPDSPNFSKWMTTDEVNDLIKNEDALQNVTNWLDSNNVTITWRSLDTSYIKAVASISTWETLLHTKFYDWIDYRRNLTNGSHRPKMYRRSNDYSLPHDLTEHISAVFHTCQAPPLITHHAVHKPSSEQGRDDPAPIAGTGLSKSTMYVDPALLKARPSMREEIAVGSNTVTVGMLNNYYYIPFNSIKKISPKLNQSVFETSNEFFSQQDLTSFQQLYNLPPQTAVVKNGNQISVCGEGACNEGNLDIQYLMGVAQLSATIYWYVGTASPFLDWITAVANEKYPPAVNSISWGAVEQSESTSVMNQFNTQALTLAARGVTILVSSGDNGVAGSGCNCVSTSPISYTNCACQAASGSSFSTWTGSNTWTGYGYWPSFPATCPYVTAVGATMGTKTVVPSQAEPEIACQSQQGGVITTGGGFSTFYPQPSWQKAAVSAYFANNPVSGISPGFNALGRGYPDISLLGVEYQVVINGVVESIFGTSCSTPAFAGFVTLVNAIRRNQSLPSVGFLNQLLYSKKAAKKFNDVTSGSNSCCAYSGSQSTSNSATCCAAGFKSATGWDPVTGWGSINFPLFAGLFNQSIPYVKSNATSTDSNLITSVFYEYKWYIIAAIVLVALFILGCLWNNCCSKKPYRPWEQQQQQHRSCCLCCACPSSTPHPAPNSQTLYRPSTLEMNARMPPADGLTDDERVMIAQSELYDKASNRKSKFIGAHPQSPPRTLTAVAASAPSAPELDYSQPETWSLWDTEVAMLVDMGFGTFSPRQVQPVLAEFMKVPVSMNPAAKGHPNEQNFQRVIDTLVNM